MQPAGPATQFMPRADGAKQTKLFSTIFLQLWGGFFLHSGRMHQLMHFHNKPHFHVAAWASDKARWLHKEMLCGDSHQHYITLHTASITAHRFYWSMHTSHQHYTTLHTSMLALLHTAHQFYCTLHTEKIASSAKCAKSDVKRGGLYWLINGHT